MRCLAGLPAQHRRTPKPRWNSYLCFPVLPLHKGIRERVLRGDNAVADEFCHAWLGLVSRTFALNIRILPPKLEEAVRLAYLFCRIADTVEDDRAMAPTERQSLLELFIRCFDALDPAAIEAFCTALPPSWKEDVHPDRFLVAQAHLVFARHALQPAPVREAIEARVREMCGGMIHYALRREENGWFRLKTRRELLDYCYFVAGTVGLMLCDLFHWQHPMGQKRLESLRSRAVSFGLGLQLVNIARDVPADWERHTVFVPDEIAEAHGTTAERLPDPAFRTQGAAALREVLRMGQRELLEAQRYILTLPRSACRIRLFCLWPMLMAQDSLVLLAQRPEDALDPSRRVKISRAQVKLVVYTTIASCWSNLLLKLLFRSRNRKLERLLPETSA